MGEKIYLKVVKICKERHIKLGELEYQLGMAKGYFSVMANRGHEPRFQQIWDLCQILNITVEELMADE